MHRQTPIRGLLICLAFGPAATGARAADRDQRTEVPPAVKREVSFAKDVRPLLAARCGGCHLNGKKSGGFRMDSRELFLAGGDSGPAVKVGHSGDSPLVKLVAALQPDARMPPQGPILSNEHVGVLRAWIDQGLKWEDAPQAVKETKDLTAAEAEAAGLCAVKKAPSKLVYHATVGGRKYHFCCAECKKEFVARPARYGVPAAEAATGRPALNPAPVPPARSKLDAAGLAKLIDEHIDRCLAEKKVPASPPADDAEFLRRAYLDLHGVTPPADAVVAFLDSRDPDKRAKLIDRLLAGPPFGRRMADAWDYLLVPRDTPGSEPATDPFTRHLEKQFNAGVPWDRLVRELLTSTGTQKDNGAVTFYLANRNTPMVIDTVTRTFLALPLECAQCHDHPYSPWEQSDYWGLSAFFVSLRRGGVDKHGVVYPESSNPVEEAPSRLQASLPSAPSAGRAETRGNRISARLPGGDPIPPERDRPVLARPLAAAWITAPDNPYFARAAVNRTWWLLFGRGLVNPVDDMSKPEATATHPELLDALAAQFVASGFGMKHLIRAICNSSAYQRSSRAVPGNAGEFVAYFLGEKNAAPTDYTQGITQALRLMNGVQFNDVEALLDRLAPRGTEPARAIESFHLAVLSRRPTAGESARLVEYVKSERNPREAFADILWALLKSGEFVVNH